MYLISIYFDEKSNEKLQRYIDKIAKETGNDFMTANHVPPHMTISQIEAKSVDVLVPYMETFNGKLYSGEIQFVSVGMLLPYVIYATPLLNDYLQDLSEKIYNCFSKVPETSINKYYRPLSWMPHVTLGKTLTKEQMQIAVSIMQENFTPFTAKARKIRLARVNPHEDVVKVLLE